MPLPDKSTLQKSYQTTLRDAQNELPSIARVWSIIFHAPVIDHLFSLLSATLLRPRPLLVGAIAAMIGFIGFYLFSHLYNTDVSGEFVSVLGFILGWVIGLLFDIFSLATRRHLR
jgi:hypothetical protein